MPQTRPCGPCTACCGGWMRLKVGDHAIAPGHPCPHAGDEGCTIYDRRPAVCRDFVCAWAINDLDYPQWLRPDNARVILKYADLTPEVSALCAIPTGTRVAPRVVEFLRGLSRRHGLPILCFERRRERGKFLPEVSVTGFGPPGMEAIFGRIRARIEGFERMGPG